MNHPNSTDFSWFNKRAIEAISKGQTKHQIHKLLEYPDILNNPSTPLSVVECYFLLRDNEFHTLHYIITHVLKDKFTAKEIGEAMKIYMLS